MTKTIAAGALLLVVGFALPADAAGALAVGTTANVAKDGIAFGTAWNYESEAKARDVALDNCKKFKGAARAVRQCRLVGSFDGECYAISMDPKVGTPGAGWAIAATKALAEARATDNCRAAAGRGRTEFCKVTESNCDSAKKSP